MNNIVQIYAITNKINQKFYIGQTWQSLENRFQQHKFKSSECLKLKNAINKYGKENFNIELLAICNTQNIADYLEISFIKEYNSIKNGYNLKEGGANGKLSDETKNKMSISKIGNTSRLGIKHSEETKSNMSKLRIGIVHSNKTKSNISASLIDNKNNLGKKRSEETKKKMSESQIMLSFEQILAIQNDLRSSRVIAKEYGVGKTTILRYRRKRWPSR